jgi:hypothetical protein
MKEADANKVLVDGYLRLLDNLSPGSKLDLISRLAMSVKSDITDRKTSFKKSFGAFESTKSAQEIIEEIRASRIFYTISGTGNSTKS